MVELLKDLLANAGNPRDVDSIPGLGRSPGGGNGNRLQYSCLENPRIESVLDPMDRIPWTEEPGRLQLMGLQSRMRLSMHA